MDDSDTKIIRFFIRLILLISLGFFVFQILKKPLSNIKKNKDTIVQKNNYQNKPAQVFQKPINKTEKTISEQEKNNIKQKNNKTEIIQNTIIKPQNKTEEIKEKIKEEKAKIIIPKPVKKILSQKEKPKKNQNTIKNIQKNKQIINNEEDEIDEEEIELEREIIINQKVPEKLKIFKEKLAKKYRIKSFANSYSASLNLSPNKSKLLLKQIINLNENNPCSAWKVKNKQNCQKNLKNFEEVGYFAINAQLMPCVNKSKLEEAKSKKQYTPQERMDFLKNCYQGNKN